MNLTFTRFRFPDKPGTSLKRKLAAAAGVLGLMLPAIGMAQVPTYCTTSLHSVACSASDNINTVSIAGTTLNNANTGCSATTGQAYTAYPATGSTTATLLRQVTYNLSVTSTANSILSVWIDYNQNGTFEATEWQQIATSTTPNTAVTIPITIPNSAVLGQTGMRIRSRLTTNINGATNACTSMGSGETEDYIVTIGPAPVCSGTPTAGTVAGNLTVCSGQTTALSLSGQTLGTTLQWQSSPDGSTWTDISGATGVNFTTGPVTGTTHYRVNVTCGASTVPTPAVQVGVTTGAITSFPHTQNFDGVTAPAMPCGWTVVNVNNDPNTWQTAAVNPSSTPNSLAYPYHSTNNADDWAFSPAIAMNAANTYQVTFKYRVESSLYPEKLEVKWGNAATVAAMTNTIFTGNNLTNTTYATTTATIAPTASGNYYLGFHVFSDADMYNVFVDDVTITELSACTGAPVAGTVPAGPLNVCGTSPTTIAATGSTIGQGITYQWQEATAATGPWTNAAGGSGATTTTYTLPVLTSNRFYRLTVTCANSSQSSSSSAVEVIVNTGAITTFPHTQNFDGVTAPALPCGWSVLNINNDAKTWVTATTNPDTPPNALTYSYSTTQAANDWVFSPAIAMNATSQYVITFRYRVYSATYPEALDVKWGNAATVAAMTNTIFTGSNLTNTTYATVTHTITPATAGNYYVGFHAYSAANMWDIHIDDFTVTELAACSGTPVAGTGPASINPVCAGNSTTLAVTGASQGLGLTYQWEQASAASGPWTNVTGGSGATTTTFTTPALSATTFYRLKVTCANSSQDATSAAMEVTVNNPTITASSGDSRCGSGTVTLSATPSAGATVNWYTAATGGAPVASGATYSPNVTATTTYYATAAAGGVTENVGITTGGTGTFITNAAGWGLHFTATVPVTINTVHIYPFGTGTVTINITNTSDVVLYSAAPVNVTGTGTQKVPVPVNLTIPAGTYKMVMSYTGITNIVREISGTSFPYTSPSGAVSITAGANGAGTASTTGAYYWFYDWIISTGCESARTAVVATVNPAPVVNLGADITLCGTASATLNAGNAGATYQWSLNGTAISGATAQTLPVTTAGTYAVTVTSGGCSSTDTIVVTTGTAPAAPTISAGGSTTICQGASVALTGATTTAGATYRWSRNGAPIAGATAATYTATTAGNYRVIATAGGCSDSSAVTAVTVNPKPAMPTITKAGNMLTASATTGTYQWYSVSGTTMTPVPGANSQSFTPAVNGDYTVMVTVNGCDSDAAATMNVVLGIATLAPGMSLELHPNPTAGMFEVKLTGFEKEATLQLLNVTGQVITSETVSITGQVTAKAFNLSGMAKGVYILKVTSGDNLTFRKVVLD